MSSPTTEKRVKYACFDPVCDWHGFEKVGKCPKCGAGVFIYEVATEALNSKQRSLAQLLNELSDLCTCGDVEVLPCIFCEAADQIAAQKRTIDLLSNRRPVETSVVPVDELAAGAIDDSDQAWLARSSGYEKTPAPIRDMIEANLAGGPAMKDPALAKAMDPPPYIDGESEKTSCGCIETYPQLVPGRVSHGPGCDLRTGGNDTSDHRDFVLLHILYELENGEHNFTRQEIAAHLREECRRLGLMAPEKTSVTANDDGLAVQLDIINGQIRAKEVPMPENCDHGVSLADPCEECCADFSEKAREKHGQ